MPDKLGDWRAQNPAGSTGTFAEAAALGELLALAVKGIAAQEALELASAGNLAGKTVMDMIWAALMQLALLSCSAIYVAFSASRATTGCTHSSY
jgi:hypothetical protein